MDDLGGPPLQESSTDVGHFHEFTNALVMGFHRPRSFVGCLCVAYLVVHPTARKWVITPIKSGLTRSLSHVNHWGYNPLTIRG